MEIKNYYENLINNKNLPNLNHNLYFDYEGEGYSIAEFSEINPLMDIENKKDILSYFNDEIGFNFYQYEKDGTVMKAMDLLLKKSGEFTDHYLCNSTVADMSELAVETKHKTEVGHEDTYAFMKRFWEGEEVKYSKSYVEHSSFISEITYENVIEIHPINNYLVMLCDAKINGLYGTLADLYVIENDEFIEHWDVFTVDKIQPPEPEFSC